MALTIFVKADIVRASPDFTVARAGPTARLRFEKVFSEVGRAGCDALHENFHNNASWA